MTGNPTFRREEVELIFGRTLPLIEAALLHQYALGRDEVTEVERCLHDWLCGFVRRPGSPQTYELLRPHLISMACQAAHVYWSGQLGQTVSLDENVRRSLALGPRQMAGELEKQAEQEDGKENS